MQAFARRLGKDKAVRTLERPFVRYVGNSPPIARHHFHGLKLADCVPEEEIDPEFGEKLDAIAAVAESTRPVGEG
ncbi:MAG: hypothetical protein OXE86_18565 [Alphaproteobacteria bacterium]|nr:hypothetical protein [Alphaproteobacteria bacterium]